MLANLDSLLSKAKQKGVKRLVIAAAEDKHVLEAVAKAIKLGLIAPIFIGNKKEILTLSKELNFSVCEQDIIEAESSDESCRRAVKMVSEGKADFLMKGLVSTGKLLKEVVSKKYGLLSGKLLSHLAIFESPNYPKLFGVTDAAMNIAPTLQEKQDIVENAVCIFNSLGITIPKVAVLAAVEKVNQKMTATTDAPKLIERAKQCKLNYQIEGPFALDNAISPEAAKHKGLTGNVAGDADILLAPDIEAGNILYKSLSFLGNARCAAIITGSSAPVILTSRADNEETKFLSIVLGVATC